MFDKFDFASADKPLPSMRSSYSMEGNLRSAGGIDVVEKVDRVMDMSVDEHIKGLKKVMSEVNDQ